MATKKAEMEKDRTRYYTLMDEARAAHRKGDFRKAIQLALSTWDHIDGMMQYERKYNDREFSSVESIDIVLRYAPLIFDFSSLDRLESLLKSRRRIERDTSDDDMTEKLAEARALMWAAHRMWDYLEQNPDARQDELRQVIGGDQDRWRSLAETWEKMELVRRMPEGGSYRLALLTRMGELISGKCPSCGAVTEAPKAMFLEAMTCLECQKSVLYVVLAKTAVSGAEE